MSGGGGSSFGGLVYPDPWVAKPNREQRKALVTVMEQVFARSPRQPLFYHQNRHRALEYAKDGAFKSAAAGLQHCNISQEDHDLIRNTITLLTE